jgi:hypothetical protein
VKELISEVGRFKNLEIENKIQLRDQATGEIYCTWIENGEWVKIKSSCGDLTKSQTILNDQNSKQTSDQNLEQMKESVLTSTE